MIKKTQRALFYLLLLLLPTQFGRHFFFDFSFISGIRSDYLTPTIYLTDIIIILLIVLWAILRFKNLNLKIIWDLGFWIWCFIIVYLLFNSIFIAGNQWAALYKLAKIIEFILLGYVIVKIRPKFIHVVFFLSVGVMYSSVIAIWQFILQRSIGGGLWFLGERTFYASTPGIAAFSLKGSHILRPYATFPHPNVLGGFLAIVLPIFFALVTFYPSTRKPRLVKAGMNGSIWGFRYGVSDYKRSISRVARIWLKSVLILGIPALFMTFSRAAWVVTLFGFVIAIIGRNERVSLYLKKNKEKALIIFYSLFLLSLIIFQIIPYKSQSAFERNQLTKSAIEMVSGAPFFGIGLNNFVLQARNYLPRVSDLFIFQPVHNIYLLILAELGTVGFIMAIFFIFYVFLRALKTHHLLTIAILQIIFLGFFDHYLFTLQQGQLLFTLFASLAFLREKN